MEGRGRGVWVGGWVDGVCVWWVGGGGADAHFSSTKAIDGKWRLTS